jgi:hypothetical protein
MLSLLLKAKLKTLRLESFFCISTKFLKISGFGSKEYILDLLNFLLNLLIDCPILAPMSKIVKLFISKFYFYLYLYLYEFY